MSVRTMTQEFARPDNGLAIFHLAVSLAMFFGAIALGAATWGQWWLTLPLILVFAGASVRLFGVQHDCGHYAYFTSQRANIVTGVLLGGITCNPFFAMRYNHNRHHAFIGNLDEMPSHEVLTWTVRQYLAAGLWGRLYYRVYRSLPVIFLLGPLFIIFLRYRVPKNWRKTGLLDIVVQNALMAMLWGGIYLASPVAFAFFLAGAVATACGGVVMVYVGHNHENTYWARADEVQFEDAALKGACVITLGPVFDFMTFNFAYHDLHHLNAKVPAYRLRACHQALTPVLQPTRLGLWQALQCIQWKLWDEDRGRMVRFRDIAQAQLQPVAG